MKSEEIFNELIKIIQPSNIKVNESMKKHTTFKIGGNADFFVTVRTIEEIKDILEFVKQNNIELTVLGNGSNILVTDKGIRGIVLKIDLQGIEIQKKEEDVAMQLTETMVAEETEVYSYNYNQVFVTVGAGVKMGNLAQILLKEEIEGFEFAAGIPGTIGGAIRMNAGAYGKEMKDVVLSTTCMDKNGKLYTFSNEEQEFSYRNSIFQKKDYIIIETKLKLEYGKKDEIQKKMEEYFKSRKEKQPIEYPSAGSSFKRQEGIITAKLIDDVGLKGYKIGGAQVSEKHAGFIVNYNNATATDVINLINYIKEKVYSKYGIKIEEEIKIIGER